MDSGNASAANDTASGGHLGHKVSSTWCEHTVIVLSVLMTLNMIGLMLCYRMLIMGKLQQLLDRLAPLSERQVMVTAPSGVTVQGGRSHRPSTDSFYYPPPPPTNLAPSTVVINNIGVCGTNVMSNPRATTASARMGERRVVMIQNPVFSMADESPLSLDNVGGEAIKSEDRKRKTSVFMDRPLPALPEQNEERKMKNDNGLEREEPIDAERRVKKFSTGSATSYVHKDEVVSISSSELKRPTTETGETDTNPRLYVDIELFI